MSIKVFISGEPYCQNKSRGNVLGSKKWSQTIMEATKDLPKINAECKAKITFILPANKYPSDFPYGPDLDNLLKRLFDALKKTVLFDDSYVKTLIASKKKASDGEPVGACIEIQELRRSYSKPQEIL